MGHAANAATQFKKALDLLPGDKLLTQLVAMTSPTPTSTPETPAPAAPQVPPDKVLKAEQFVGNWKASSQGASFQLDLTRDGGFTWTYARGKNKQSVKGVYAVDQNNLALETDDGGGTMLAEVEFLGASKFKFKMIGDDPKSPGLEFAKAP
jgi:hypothetical protein